VYHLRAFGKFVEYSLNCLANVGSSDDSQHFLLFGHFELARFTKFAKLNKLANRGKTK
jgi:hypothetical protein